MPTPETVPKTAVRMRKELGSAEQLLEPLGAHLLVGHAHGLALGQGKIKSAADGQTAKIMTLEDGDDCQSPSPSRDRECSRMDSS